MQLGPLSFFVVISSLCCACASSPSVARAPAQAAFPASDYKVITPDVSTYPPRVAARPVTPPDENEDVMAGILGIPPGQ